MKCKICGEVANKTFNAKMLNKYDVQYYICPNCDFLQTEEPYWLHEAYTESINSSDTGYIARNIHLSNRIAILLFLLFDKESNFVDYAGGYGVFVRMMRDLGFNFYWDDKYTENIFARGFEWLDKSNTAAITALEVFEHFVEPRDELKSLLQFANTIIFSTELYPDSRPLPEDWWYFGLEHGQHISFYSKKTLQFLADDFNLNYYSLGSLHILTQLNIPFWKIKLLTLSRFGLATVIKYITRSSKTLDDHKQIVNATRGNSK